LGLRVLAVQVIGATAGPYVFVSAGLTDPHGVPFGSIGTNLRAFSENIL
jgi:hypothetical protein